MCGRIPDALCAHLRRLRGEEQNSSIPGASRGGCTGSGVWAGSAGPSGYHDETSNTTPTALYRRWGRRHLREGRDLPFSARATFHPDCTVGTGFSPVRPLLRAGFSSGVLASCADAKIRTIFSPACESGSRAVTAGSEFHRPRSTMTLLIMPQRGRGAYFLAAGINYVTK